MVGVWLGQPFCPFKVKWLFLECKKPLSEKAVVSAFSGAREPLHTRGAPPRLPTPAALLFLNPRPAAHWLVVVRPANRQLPERYALLSIGGLRLPGCIAAAGRHFRFRCAPGMRVKRGCGGLRDGRRGTRAAATPPLSSTVSVPGKRGVWGLEPGLGHVSARRTGPGLALGLSSPSAEY